jgi:CheY-like chemotaxis protein
MNDDGEDLMDAPSPRGLTWGADSNMGQQGGGMPGSSSGGGGGFGNLGFQTQQTQQQSFHQQNQNHGGVWDSAVVHPSAANGFVGGSAGVGGVDAAATNADGGWDRSSLKVLVAEDDDICKRFFIRMLQQLGVKQILAVDNGLEAMRAVRRENFTHVFLDLVLPCIDGKGKGAIRRFYQPPDERDTQSYFLDRGHTKVEDCVTLTL